MKKTIDHCLFRELYHNYVLIFQNPIQSGLTAGGFSVGRQDNCILAYGYVDHTAGLSFHILCSAEASDEGKLSLGSGSKDTVLFMRYNSISGEVQSLGTLIPNEEFFDKVRMVNNGYKTNPALEVLRELEALDHLRHPQYPDDILVKFLRQGIRSEEIWCRMEGISGRDIVGRVLNEPFGNMGIHAGSLVKIVFGTVDGKMTAVAKI